MLKNSILTLGTLACLAGLGSAQQIVLPDNMNLGNVTSVSTVWRVTLGHFQVAYDTSHFTNAGVTGPIIINRLRFRSEDGQKDLGGQVYTGVTVEVGESALDYAAMSTTFASNRGTMGLPGTTNLTIAPASGTIPNDYTIDIDLVAIGASIVYDPTLGNDLLIDISYPAPVPPVQIVPFSVGSATVATARARMLTTATAGALTGAFGAAPSLLVDFVGIGGYPAHNPARSERYGFGCAATGLASFYQDWQTMEAFDLANTSLTLTPDNVAAPTSYTVTSGTTPPDLTKLNGAPNSIADEGVVTHALGFTLNFPSGSTTTIKPTTNGFVWLDPTMNVADGISPTVSELMGIAAAQGARFALAWYDFHAGRNTSTHPNSGLHVLTDTSGGPGNAVCYVTWYHIGVFNQTGTAGTSVNDLQCVIHEATGVVEYRYGSLNITPASLCITGFSPGRVGTVASMHPGPRDLSHETPFSTSPDGPAHALTHNAAARPIMGSPFTLQAFNQPAGTVVGAMLANFAAVQPALAMAPVAPGCGVSLSPVGLITLDVFVTPTGTVTSVPITIPPYYMGAVMYTQYAALDGIGNVFTSNGVKLTVGLN